MTDFEEPVKKESPVSHRVACGLVWALHGHPFYFCVVKESRIDEEKTMEARDVLDIFEEGSAKSIQELTLKLSDLPDYRCRNIYCDNDPQYFPYIRELNRWKRETGTNVRLVPTQSVNFEASILEIKDYVTEKKLMFLPESLIRSQLSVFSKISFKTPDEFYAVQSLCAVIAHFKKRARMDEFDQETNVVPHLKAWY